MSFKSCTCISLKTKKMQTLLDGSNFNKTDPANVQGWAHRRGSPVIRLRTGAVRLWSVSVILGPAVFSYQSTLNYTNVYGTGSPRKQKTSDLFTSYMLHF